MAPGVNRGRCATGAFMAAWLLAVPAEGTEKPLNGERQPLSAGRAAAITEPPDESALEPMTPEAAHDPFDFERDGIPRDEQAGPTRRPPAYGRAALEMLGLLSIGLAQYWLNAGANSRDWDYPRVTERFKPSAMRFDNNTHLTNNLMHPFAGSAYYGLARTNGLGVAASAGYAVASSAVWEWGLEWREKVSINDMIATTVGGTAAGEFFVQLASYLNSAPAETSFGQDLAKTTLGLPVWLHDQIDGRRPDPTATRDNLGFSNAYDHRFIVDVQNAWLDDGRDRSAQVRGVALNGRLVSIPGYLDPETFDVFFSRGNFTSASALLHFGAGGLRETRVEFDAVLAGYYTQLSTPAVLSGLIGFATGLEYVDTETLDQGDEYGIVRFAVPELAASWKGKNRQLDVRARASLDFGAIRTLAWPEVREAEPDAVYKSSLDGQYQYNYGLSTWLYAELRLFAARLSAELGRGGYRSIQGFDRFQERITRDLSGREVLEEHRVGFALEPPGSVLRFNGHFERFLHESWLGGQTGRRLERRYVMGVGIAF